MKCNYPLKLSECQFCLYLTLSTSQSFSHVILCSVFCSLLSIGPKFWFLFSKMNSWIKETLPNHSIWVQWTLCFSFQACLVETIQSSRFKSAVSALYAYETQSISHLVFVPQKVHFWEYMFMELCLAFHYETKY